VLGTDDDDVALDADVVIAAVVGTEAPGVEVATVPVVAIAVVVVVVVVAGGRGQLGCPRFEQTTSLWHSFGASVQLKHELRRRQMPDV
jgi:hypothetical protein